MSEPDYKWVECDNFKMSKDALKCGNDVDGSEIYVGQAKFSGDKLPVKIVPRRHSAYVSYNEREFQVDDFKVLCARKVEWISSKNGLVPDNAIPGGKTADGEPLYIGRVHLKNATLLGKVHGSNGYLFVPYNGKEISHKQYETLVMKR